MLFIPFSGKVYTLPAYHFQAKFTRLAVLIMVALDMARDAQRKQNLLWWLIFSLRPALMLLQEDVCPLLLQIQVSVDAVYFSMVS